MEEEKKLCAVCNNVAKQRCSGCQAVYYCCREHQKSDWKIHTKTCRAYKLVENSRIGRHYVATRNINIGEPVIYDKTPLITAPGYAKAIKFFDCDYHLSLETPPICLECYVELTFANAKLCDKCEWPLCHRCTKHGTECEFTIKHRKTRINITETEYGKPHPAYEIIGVIRALALRENDVKSYRKLMNLEHHLSMKKKYDRYNAIGKAARFVKTYFDVEDVEEEEISKIIAIIQVNGFETDSVVNASYASIYDHSSYIEHNCRPNCSSSVTVEGGILFWAAVPISKGEHISTSYVIFNWRSNMRRSFLYCTKYFDCICERCKDPTEFGTMFNAMKCTKTRCNGYLLPTTFLTLGGKNANYVCRLCNAKVPWVLIDLVGQSFFLEMATLQISNIEQCQKFIKKWRKYFHESSQYIVSVEIEMVSAIRSICDVPDKHLTYVVNICTKLIKLVETLAPAEYTFRLRLLHLKHLASCTLMLKRIDSFTNDEMVVYHKTLLEGFDELKQFSDREPGGYNFNNKILTTIRDDLPTMRNMEETLLLVLAFRKL